MIIDQDLYDKTSFGSAKKILCSCDKCNKELYVAKQKLVRRNNRTQCHECAITKHGKARQQIAVVCKTCNHAFTKRHDTLSSWSGLCVVCSNKEIASRPEIKAIHRKNGLAFIAKYGKIPSPKPENRPRGKNHFWWGVKKRGAESPNWRGGKTPENERIRHSDEYKAWRNAVFKRDNYTCTYCSDDSGGNLNADHIKPFSLYKELRTDIENGRTLCEPCHDKYGAKVGNGKITREAKFKHSYTSMFMAA